MSKISTDRFESTCNDCFLSSVDSHLAKKHLIHQIRLKNSPLSQTQCRGCRHRKTISLSSPTQIQGRQLLWAFEEKYQIFFLFSILAKQDFCVIFYFIFSFIWAWHRKHPGKNQLIFQVDLLSTFCQKMSYCIKWN